MAAAAKYDAEARLRDAMRILESKESPAFLVRWAQAVVRTKPEPPIKHRVVKRT